MLEECRQVVGVRQSLAVVETPEVDSPALFGCFRVKLLLPPRIAESFSPAELRHVFLHELSHVRRGDVPMNWLMTLVQLAHWFNPVIWFAFSRMRADRELACDALALSLVKEEEGPPYGQTIIKLLEGFVRPAAVPGLVGILEDKNQMKRRINMIAMHKKSSRTSVLALVLLLGLGAVALTDAQTEKGEPKPPTTPAGTDAVVDPKTGLRFVVSKTIAGDNNVIEHLNKLTLSPDGRFLLWWGKVVPLDGKEAFYYTAHGDDREVAVSPNGRYIAHGEKAVWLQPVSPDTLRPNGPAKKLLELKGERLVETWGRPEAIRWTRDAETVFFRTRDPAGKSSQYAFSAATGARVNFPDDVARGLRSPDGKCVAFTDGNPGFWVQTVGEGTARNLCGQGSAPLCWAGDGRWLIGIGPGGGVARFTRYPDGQDYLVPLPSELESSSACVGTSPDRKRLFFYQPGYDLKFRVKVASAATAPLKDVDNEPYGDNGQWAPDGKALFNTAYTAQGEAALWRSPLSGEEPVQFTIKLDVSGKVVSFSVSPDGKWLLFAVRRQPDTWAFDLGVVPLSVANHAATGPATVVFRNVRRPGVVSLWSPDSTRVALTSKDDPGEAEGIWIAFTDGKAPLRLTQTNANERDLKWSPDGSMLAFVSDNAGAKELKVVSTAGGETTAIRKWDGAEEWGWSSDSKSLTIAEEGMLVRQPLSAGKAEFITNLKESGIERTSWLSWSPDGSHLALVCNKPENKDLRVWGQLLFVRVEGRRLQQTAAVDLRGGNWDYAWSPDSTHVAYTCEDTVTVRPAGRLYALAVDDVLERINAGAVPPTRRQTATVAVEKQPTETGTIPQAEPIVGPVFTDNFDNGPSKHWRFQDFPDQGQGPGRHAVENGELMLSHSRASLDGIDWADYIVTIRVCMKQVVASAIWSLGIEARATPSKFGSGRMDRYCLGIFRNNNAPPYLWLGINYADPSDTLRHGELSRSPYNVVPDKWYTLEFEVRGQHLRGYLDGKLMVEATDTRLTKGKIWFGASAGRTLFDDFSVRQLP